MFRSTHSSRVDPWRRTPRTRAAKLFFVLLLVACTEPTGVTQSEEQGGGGGGGGGGSSPGLSLVSGDSQSATVGQALANPLEVRLLDASGNPVPSEWVHWSVTQGGGSVEPDSSQTRADGTAGTVFVLGTGAGAHQAVAWVTGDSAVFDATALPGAPATIEVNPTSLALGVGQDGQLAATVEDEHGNTVSPEVSWSSSNAGVASVNTAGAVTGVSEGSASIEATVDGLAAEAQVQVEEEPSSVQSVTVSPASAVLVGVGSTRQYQAEAQDSQGNSVPATLSWTSTDTGVVTVDGNGLATARGLGTAFVVATAACCGSPADSGAVDVTGPPPPPPVSGFPNLPAGYEIFDDNDWDAIPVWNGPLVNGWGKVISSGPGGGPVGEGAVIQDPTAPDGDADVFQMTYNPGHDPGEDGYGVYRTTGGALEGYFAYWFRIGEQGDPGSFKRHGNGLKLFALQNAGGGNLNVHWMDSARLGNGPICDLVAFDSWDRQSSSWNGPHNDPSCAHAGEMDYWLMGAPDGGPKIEIGKWTLIEMIWGPDSIQWFMDGEEVAEYSKSGDNGFNGMGGINITGTWGGGSSSVPSPQSYYIARSIIAIP